MASNAHLSVDLLTTVDKRNPTIRAGFFVFFLAGIDFYRGLYPIPQPPGGQSLGRPALGPGSLT